MNQYKLYTIDLKLEKRKVDGEKDYGLTTNIEILFNDQNYDAKAISLDGNFIIYEHDEENKINIFSRQKHFSPLEKVPKMFLKDNLVKGNQINVIDSNNKKNLIIKIFFLLYFH